MSQRPLVAIVDDDESVRESLPDLIGLLGYRAEVFPSAEAFLASPLGISASCLVLDVAMPGMSGPELADHLRRSGRAIPIVYMTAYDDESSRIRRLAQGVADCLFKPFSDTALADALQRALEPT